MAQHTDRNSCDLSFAAPVAVNGLGVTSSTFHPIIIILRVQGLRFSCTSAWSSGVAVQTKRKNGLGVRVLGFRISG